MPPYYSATTTQRLHLRCRIYSGFPYCSVLSVTIVPPAKNLATEKHQLESSYWETSAQSRSRLGLQSSIGAEWQPVGNRWHNLKGRMCGMLRHTAGYSDITGGGKVPLLPWETRTAQDNDPYSSCQMVSTLILFLTLQLTVGSSICPFTGVLILCWLALCLAPPWRTNKCKHRSLADPSVWS